MEMILKPTEKEMETLTKVSEITGVDYDGKEWHQDITANSLIEALRDMIIEYHKLEEELEEQKEKKFIDAIASKVAERMPINSSQEDIENLIEALLSLQNPFVNSEGKPIAIKMSRYEIEKKFARK